MHIDIEQLYSGHCVLPGYFQIGHNERFLCPLPTGISL